MAITLQFSMGFPPFSLFESFLIHESLKIPFGAFVAAFHFSSNPKCRKGSHQTPDSESGPWESHPCRVLRQLRREVSLSLLRFMAVSVAVGYFWMARKRSSPCFPLSPGWTGGSWRTFIRLRFSPPRRNVSDECVFGFQGPRKAHRLLTFSLPNFFARFPHFFKKIFCAGSRKQKSAHCTCLVGVVSAKNKTR